MQQLTVYTLGIVFSTLMAALAFLFLQAEASFQSCCGRGFPAMPVRTCLFC